MNKKKLLFMTIFLMGFSFLPLHADFSIDMKLRFFEGIREGKIVPPKFVTSSYLQPTVTASIPSKFLLAEEQEQIKKVFNLKEVQLITEADLTWKSKLGDLAHIFRLDSREYLLVLAPVAKEQFVSKKGKSQGRMHQFKIEISEQKGKDKISLMDTEIILPEKNIAVFGFEDNQGNPYFLSFHVLGISISGAAPPPPPPPPPEKIERIKKIKEFEKGAVKCVGEIKPPKLLKMVEPVYPEEARKSRVSGVVILGARTDEEGRVASVMIYKSKAPILNKPAIDAVRQWKYEPLIIKGKPEPALLTVTVRFVLKGKDTSDFEKGAVVVGGEIKSPKLLKKVDPVYPEELKEEGIQGVVVLKCRTDKEGNVEAVKVLKSENSMLNKPAVDAVKQWKYEPMYIKGKPHGVVFTVTMKFKLKEEKKKS